MLISGLMLFGLSAVSQENAHGEPQKPIVSKILSASDDGRIVELALNGALAVRLSAQFGTGYSWSVEKEGRRVLRLAMAYVETAPRGSPGAAETQVFIFTSIATGSEDVELAYRQPWQKDQPPARTFHFRAIVR